MIATLDQQVSSALAVRRGAGEFPSGRTIGKRNPKQLSRQHQFFGVARFGETVEMKDCGVMRLGPLAFARDISATGGKHVEYANGDGHGQGAKQDRKHDKRGQARPGPQRRDLRFFIGSALRTPIGRFSGHGQRSKRPSCAFSGLQRPDDANDLGVFRIQSESESKPSREPQHAMVFDHYVPVQVVQAFLARPLDDASQQIAPQAEVAEFASNDDRELGIALAFIDHCPGNGADASFFRRQRLDQYQREGVAAIDPRQPARVFRRELGDRMQKSKTDLFRCQLAETAAQRFGILRFDGSGDQLAAVVQQYGLAPGPAQLNSLETIRTVA
ncbi:MAG: hypothetical protein R6V61_03950 [Wenzhouxiangellaceae bacterium]